jgi:hypothetical protein
MPAKRDQENEQRLELILAGAFSGPPTPLKNIPKRNGEARGADKPDQPRRRRRQRKKRAA